jgi:hypothetical protein
MKIREAIYKIKNGKENFIALNREIFAMSYNDSIAIVFSSNDAIELLDNKINNFKNIEINNNFVFEDENDDSFSYKLASSILQNKTLDDLIQVGIFPSLNNLKKLSNNQPVLLKFSQWGGMGGQGVDGAGSGMGIGSPMAGAVNFDNPGTRIQFDKFLDQIRRDGVSNGWFESLETRMQENPLYGHQRNEEDKNLINYRLTYKERMKEKKKEMIKRILENRNKFNEAIDSNSVENIKKSPVDPKHYSILENKLESRRHQESNTKKQKRHGPESNFIYFPPPPMKVTAQTIVHNGGSSAFDVDIDSEIRNQQYVFPEEISGRLRVKKFPWSMSGPTRQKTPIDLKEDNNLMWGGDYIDGPTNNQGGSVKMDLLFDSRGKNPGEMQPEVFEDLPLIIDQMKSKLKLQDDFIDYKGNETDIPLEKQLSLHHRKPPQIGIQPTNYELQRRDDPFPYDSKNLLQSRYRLNKGNS